MRSKAGTSGGELGARGLVAFEDVVDLGVGHAARGADDAFGDFVVENVAAGVDVHEAGEDEAVFVGAKAADVGRELLREHGDGAVGEVDGVAAQACFEVERGAGMDVVGDVGDVDLKMPVAGGGVVVDENGVVEVAGGLAVDGDDGQVAEVAAGGDDFGVEMSDSAGFGENLVGEDAREMVLADDHLDVDAEVVGMAENFDDLAAGGASGCGPGGDFNVDDETFEIARVVVADGAGGFFAEDAMRVWQWRWAAGELGVEGMTMGWVIRSSKGVT